MRLLKHPTRPHWTPFVSDTFSLRRYREWGPFLNPEDVSYWNTEADAQAWKQLASLDSMPSFYKDSSLFAVKKLSINSSSADMCATPFKDGIVFSSSREGGKSKTQDWTSKPYLSLWYSKGKENKFETPVAFDMATQSKFNDGPICFSADGNEMYITRNSDENGKAARDKSRIVRLKILSAPGQAKDITHHVQKSISRS